MCEVKVLCSKPDLEMCAMRGLKEYFTVHTVCFVCGIGYWTVSELEKNLCRSRQHFCLHFYWVVIFLKGFQWELYIFLSKYCETFFTFEMKYKKYEWVLRCFNLLTASRKFLTLCPNLNLVSFLHKELSFLSRFLKRLLLCETTGIIGFVDLWFTMRLCNLWGKEFLLIINFLSHFVIIFRKVFQFIVCVCLIGSHVWYLKI